MVYPQLKESLVYAREKNLKTTLTTNALNLKRKAEELIEGGLSELYISLDGLQETHNYIRGNKQSFQKAIEGINYLSQFENAPEISIYCVHYRMEIITSLKNLLLILINCQLNTLALCIRILSRNRWQNRHNAIYGNLYRATHSNVEETDFSKSI